MQTLGKSITSSFFTSPDGFSELKRIWKEQHLDKSPDPAVHILYLILRGKDYRRACTKLSNKNKLENGGIATWSPRHAIFRILRDQGPCNGDKPSLYDPFAGVLRLGIADFVRSLVPKPGSIYNEKGNITPEAMELGEYVAPVGIEVGV